MSPTYLGQNLRHCLGHRYGVCEHLWQNHNELAIVGDENISHENYLRTQSTPVRRSDPYFQVGWLKLLQFDLYSRKVENGDDSLELRRDPLQQIDDRCQLQPRPATRKVGGIREPGFGLHSSYQWTFSANTAALFKFCFKSLLEAARGGGGMGAN